MILYTTVPRGGLPELLRRGFLEWVRFQARPPQRKPSRDVIAVRVDPEDARPYGTPTGRFYRVPPLVADEWLAGGVELLPSIPEAKPPAPDGVSGPPHADLKAATARLRQWGALGRFLADHAAPIG